MTDGFVLNEVYLSVQGESTWAGLPCVFVRLTGCHLRCAYCDTAYAFSEGRRESLADVRAKVLYLAKDFSAAEAAAVGRLPLVELTGGEPLLQPQTPELMRLLADDGFTVLLETSGALDIRGVDPRVRRIMDLKCPSSGEHARNRWENLEALRPTDEIKFVVASAEDYAWMRECLDRHGLAGRCPVLVSWASPLAPAQQHPSLKPWPTGHHRLMATELAERIVADGLPVRFQLQLHKQLWPPDRRGV